MDEGCLSCCSLCLRAEQQYSVPGLLGVSGGELDTFPTGDSIVLMGDFNTCGHDMTVTPGGRQQVRGAIKTEVDLTKPKSPCWQASSSVARCWMWRRSALGVSTLWVLWGCPAALFGGWGQCWDGGTSIKKGGLESEFLLQGDHTSQPNWEGPRQGTGEENFVQPWIHLYTLHRVLQGLW